MKFAARMKQPPKERANRIDILIGDSGIGKSSMLRLLPDRLSKATGEKWHMKLWHVGGQAFEDVTGLPTIMEDVVLDNGKVMSRSEYDMQPTGRIREIRKRAVFAKSDFVPGAIWHEDHTVGVLDELPTAPPLIQNQLREMIDGQLNGDPIDPKCFYVATGNPPDPRFVTVNALDEALEKRLKVYVVQPTTDELLKVWQRMMPDTIYSFLVMDQSFIDALSPREWVGIAKDVDDVLRGGGTLDEAIEEAIDELLDHDNIAVKLRQFIKFGNDPYYFPVLGKQLLSSTDEELQEILERFNRWFKDNRRGFVGASKNDFVRALENITTDEVVKQTEETKAKIAHRVSEVIKLLIEQHCTDMGRQVLAVVAGSPYAAYVGSELQHHKGAIEHLYNVMEQFEATKEQLATA